MVSWPNPVPCLPGFVLTMLFRNSRLRSAHLPEQGEERHLDPLC